MSEPQYSVTESAYHQAIGHWSLPPFHLVVGDSAVEDQDCSLCHLFGCTPFKMGSNAIPVKAGEVTTLTWIPLWEEAPTTNAELAEERKGTCV